MDGTHGTYGTNVNSSARVDRCSLPGMRLQKRPVPSCPPYPGWRRRKGTILVSLLTGSPIKVEDVHSDLIIPFPTGRVRFLASPGSKLPGCHHLVPSGQKLSCPQNRLHITTSNPGRGGRRVRGRTACELTLPLNPRTSNIRKNKSPNYGRQPIPVGVRSHRPERTISKRNCPEPTSATRRIVGLIDLFLPRKPHTGSAVAGPPDECKSRGHLSTEWRVLRR
jgi:hypothetical protein